MRILIVNIYYYPDLIGGAENSVKLLAENLSFENEVSVFCAGNDISKKEIINNVTIYRCQSKDYKLPHHNNLNLAEKIGNKLLELKNPSIMKEYLKVLDVFQPDIVHTNNLYGLSTELWKVTKDKKIPIVHTLRDYELFNPLASLKGLSSIMSVYNRRKSRCVNVLTAPSNYMLEYAKQSSFFSKAEFEIIPNAIELDIEETKNIISKRMLNNEKNIHYLYVGMLSEHKGLNLLLEAFSKINNEFIDLTICGTGKLENLIKDYSERDKRIIFKGQLKKEQLVVEYKTADVLVVPSQWDEPFGRVVIEGNMYGLPVIGSNSGGIKEIIDSIKTGVLFQKKSIDDLINKIIFFSDRSNIKGYYSNIINGIQNYSIEKQINYFNNLYRTLIKKVEDM